MALIQVGEMSLEFAYPSSPNGGKYGAWMLVKRVAETEFRVAAAFPITGESQVEKDTAQTKARILAKEKGWIESKYYNTFKFHKPE